MDTDRKRHPQRGTSSFVAAAVVNAIILVIVNAHEVWRPWLGGIVTPAFADAVWVMNLGGAVQVIGNLVLAVTRPPPLQRFVELAFVTMGFVGSLVVYRVFPFDLSRFGAWANTALRVLLILGIVGSAIGIVVAFVRFVSAGRTRHVPAHS